MLSPTLVTPYYYFASLRVAMGTNAGVTYLFGDHLGSMSASIAPDGSMAKQVKASPQRI